MCSGNRIAPGMAVGAPGLRIGIDGAQSEGAKDRKPSRRDAQAQNGRRSSPAPKLNGRASLRLQKVLLQRNLATEAQIEHALASDPPSGADFGDVLVSMRILDEHELISARAELYGMDVADLRQTIPEQEALDLIPDSMAREHFVIPMALDEVGLHVAMADQPSNELLSLLGETSGTAIRPMLAPLSEIRRAIENNYRAIGGLDHLVQAFEAVEVTRRRTVDTTTVTPDVVDDDAPVVQVVGRILTQAMRDRASDVHIEPSELGSGFATGSTARSKRC